MVFGVVFGLGEWISSINKGTVTPAGTVMLSALPILTGLQLILAFISYDIAAVPKKPWHRRLLDRYKTDDAK
jgi:hypothetical protein